MLNELLKGIKFWKNFAYVFWKVQAVRYYLISCVTIANDSVPEEGWDQTGVLRKWPEVTKNFWEDINSDVVHVVQWRETSLLFRQFFHGEYVQQLLRRFIYPRFKVGKNN